MTTEPIQDNESEMIFCSVQKDQGEVTIIVQV